MLELAHNSSIRFYKWKFVINTSFQASYSGIRDSIIHFDQCDIFDAAGNQNIPTLHNLISWIIQSSYQYINIFIDLKGNYESIKWWDIFALERKKIYLYKQILYSIRNMMFNIKYHNAQLQLMLMNPKVHSQTCWI